MRLIKNKKLEINRDHLKDFNWYFQELIDSLNKGSKVHIVFDHDYEEQGMTYVISPKDNRIDLEFQKKTVLAAKDLGVGLSAKWINEVSFTLKYLDSNE